ncbi:MAG: hypothetical protein WBO32_17225 [Cyclobacteriaceae bacterium]
MLQLAKYTVILFGLFLIAAGFLMLFAPSKARVIVSKAGSTNFINYAEITLRMIPGAGMVLVAAHSKFPEVLRIAGWFIIATSLVLYLVPRRLHHSYAVRSAELLKPTYLRLISPFSMMLGVAVIYAVL